MTLFIILVGIITAALVVSNVIYIRANMALNRELREAEEKAGMYYMRLLGEASKKDM